MGGFNRTMVSPDGRLPQPSRAGDGLLANFSPYSFSAEVDATLTIAQLSGGFIHQGSVLNSDVVYTLPTAADLAAAFPSMDIGDSWSFVVTNSQAASFKVVIAVNTGITKVGSSNALKVATQSSRIFTLVKTGAATFDLY